MIFITFKTFVILGTLLMVIVMLYCGGCYSVPVWKRIVCAIILAVMGVLGTRIMAFLEMGRWAGRSFFGAVLFTPVLMIPVAYLLKVPPGTLLDLCAPSECVMLALMKVQCKLQGCCYGRVIYQSSEHGDIRFPSQIAECVAAIVLMLVLIYLIRGRKYSGTIYAWYLVIYGVVRFLLNLLRQTKPFIWGLPAGNFWSLVSITVGSVFLLYTMQIKKQEEALP